MVYGAGRISCEIGTTVYPSRMRYDRMSGSASGVCSAALWNSTMLPGCTLEVTRL